MESLGLERRHPDVRWSVLVPRGSDIGDDRLATIRRVWSLARIRGSRLGLDELGAATIHSPAGTLVVVQTSDRLGAALLRPGGVVSVVTYELREALAGVTGAR